MKRITFRFLISIFFAFLATVSATGKEPVRLLPHQTLPIEYLTSNDDVKGIIVNHYMGTGKTYLGIGFAEKFKGKKVIILAPRFIESHWVEHLKSFPVTDLSRFKFVSYDNAPEILNKLDLSDTILIADEIHNLIRMIKSGSPEKNRLYSELYIHLRTAFKIVALSGTPIYNDEYDLAYLMNLVSGKNIMPFNEEQFRIQFTDINKGRSFWRGYFFESNIMQQGMPFMATIATAPLVVLFGSAATPILISAPVASMLAFPVVQNWVMPIDSAPLRRLSVDKFQPLISKFVSFYEMQNQDLSDFPTKSIHIEDVPYNTEQFWFFLNFAEKSLANAGLARLYKDVDANLSEEYLNLNTTILQDRLANTTGAGRDIGNFEFVGNDGLIEAPKFLKILQKMRSEGIPKTVIYSNYFENGGLAFSRFLDRNGLSNSYAVLRPDLAPEKFSEIINKYNSGETRVLILHPEITEGISLKETRQFHILEPVTNFTVQEQVIARAVRYQSHSSLKVKERHVDVYVWKAIIGSMSLHTLKLQKANWFKRYAELSDWSHYGSGIAQVDKNYDKKRLSPDAQAFKHLLNVNQNMDELKSIMKDNSVEKSKNPPSLESLTEANFKDAFNFELDPILLPKTNFRFFWNFEQHLQAFGPIARKEKTEGDIGFDLEIEMPIWSNLASGFYFEYYNLKGAKKPIFDPLDETGSMLRKEFADQAVFGIGSFFKPQFKIPEFGDFAVNLRIPIGFEVALGQAPIPLVKDKADLNQFLQPGYDEISLSPTSSKFSYGFTTGATLGLEYFPMTFAGFFVEGGYRMSYQLFPINVHQVKGEDTVSSTPTWRGYLRHGATASIGLKLTY